MKSLIKVFALPTVGTGGFPDGNDDLAKIIGDIVTAIIGALGIVAVIVIVYGGISYMTSLGDSGKVKKGRDAILYGIIGLIICVLAFAITRFVINAIAQPA